MNGKINEKLTNLNYNETVTENKNRMSERKKERLYVEMEYKKKMHGVFK